MKTTEADSCCFPWAWKTTKKVGITLHYDEVDAKKPRNRPASDYNSSTISSISTTVTMSNKLFLKNTDAENIDKEVFKMHPDYKSIIENIIVHLFESRVTQHLVDNTDDIIIRNYPTELKLNLIEYYRKFCAIVISRNFSTSNSYSSFLHVLKKLHGVEIDKYDFSFLRSIQ
uniref:Uncharacterized protein n=1 Tax=Strongyloides papillosus TaxID=174720 RepID=A0A0N5B7V1_STREA